MKLLSRMKVIKRVLTDYSLRRFLLHAVSPLSWASLLALKRKAKEEQRLFRDHVSQWQVSSAPMVANLKFIFHPWMQTDRVSISIAQDEVVADAYSPDPELRMRLDRLGWVLQMAIHHQARAWHATENWLEERWKSGLACHSAYSISERLSNLILLWNIVEPKPSLRAEILRLMEDDANFLLGHFEYHGECGTNNHILNNARALVLVGSFLGNDRFYEAGCWLFEQQLKKHVSADGVLREASTHYQWVVTRWLVEVGCVFYALDQARFIQLCPLLSKMLDVCEAMKLGEGAASYLPLIGDISPDFPPRLYGGVTELGYALLGSGECIVPDPSAGDGLWARFFIGRIQPVPGDWHAEDLSWVRLKHDDWSLIAHSDVDPYDNRTTHGHHDLFSFELAYAGVPVIVDPGRKDYLAGRDLEDAGILEEWHNTILLDGYRTGFVARGYMPIPWLKKMRVRPRISVGKQNLEIRLDALGNGVSRVERILNLADSQRVNISNRVVKDNASPISVKLVMYVMGQPCLMDGGIRLEIGTLKFMLCWEGLGIPSLRKASRYYEYGVSEPCTRLEWNVLATVMEWSSNLKIVLLEEE